MSGIDEAPDAYLLEALAALVEEAFGSLRRTVQKNLAVLACAYLRLLAAGRSGYGALTLAALARMMPTPGTARAREKRLHRFLDNPRLDPRGVTDGLVRVIVGQRGQGLWPVLFDQTKAGSTQALIAGVPCEGRSLPLALYTFDYPWQERAAKSQNQLEEVFLCDVESALPSGVRAVFIGDRGYARAALLRHSNALSRLYIVRGRVGTTVDVQGRCRKLGELPARAKRPRRYRSVLYHGQQRVPVDVVAYHDPSFEQPWWLLVPADCEALLPTQTVVDLYRQRMRVEQSFRDFKTHLGLRGLKLKVRIAPRLGRLLLAFTLAYALAVAVGGSDAAQPARKQLECPRRQPRHGTCRTLSAFSVARLMLSHPQWRRTAERCLYQMILRLTHGEALLRAPPMAPIERLYAA
ncbi:MAG: transposase [Thermoanaerobaculia bacterium]